MSPYALIPIAAVAVALLYALACYARHRLTTHRCPALYKLPSNGYRDDGSFQRCRLQEGHFGPHYARWQPYGTMGTVCQRETHWNDPEPELTADERHALEDYRVAPQLAAFDRQLTQRPKPPPTGKGHGPVKLPS